MAKEIRLSEQMQAGVVRGARLLAKTVGVTLGPKGRNVVLTQTGKPPLITNDAATIAKAITLEDAFENMGVQILREAAEKTNEGAGDGTTTAIVLAQGILDEGLRSLAAGANPVLLRRGIERASEAAVDFLRRTAVPVTSRAAIAKVAALSAQDEEIGAMIAEAMEAVGTEGVINIDDGKTLRTTLKIDEGVVFDRGLLSPTMATDEARVVAELYHPYILVTDRKIAATRDLIPALEIVAEENRGLFIVAEGIEPEPMGVLYQNKKLGGITVVAIHPPEYGEGRHDKLEDFAIQTGAAFLSDSVGAPALTELTRDMLGTAEYIRADRKNTVVVGGGGDPEQIRSQLGNLRSLIRSTDYEFKKKRYEERLARFVSGVATLSIGAGTEAELQEKKLRAEDALHAAGAARAEGVVPGGGATLVRSIGAVEAVAAELSGDEKAGALAMARALEQPLRKIAENAGYDGAVVINAVRSAEAGVVFDAACGACVDAEQAGILDPVRATRLGLENAASAAALLLTAAAGLAEKEPQKKE